MRIMNHFAVMLYLALDALMDRPNGQSEITFPDTGSSQIQGATIWRDGAIPSDGNEQINVDSAFSNGFFLTPVYVDTRLGKAWEIPRANWSCDGTACRFAAIPCYDSPVPIAERSNIVLREDSVH